MLIVIGMLQDQGFGQEVASPFTWHVRIERMQIIKVLITEISVSSQLSSWCEPVWPH